MTLQSSPWRGTGGDRGPCDRLQDLARDIRRLSPDWRDPERYFERRDELAAEARRLAAAITTPPAIPPDRR